MSGVTDIPDWCTVEACGIGAYDFDGPYPAANTEVLNAMYAASPMFHIDKVSNSHRISLSKNTPQVKTPSILAIGEVDKRVPMSQGVEYFQALKSRGVPARMLMYPKDSHPIDR